MKQASLFDLTKIDYFSIDDFIVADNNNVAFDRIVSWPNWRLKNIHIVGDNGSGKTHLSHILRNISNGIFINNNNIEHHSDMLHYHACFIIDDLCGENENNPHCLVLSNNFQAQVINLFNMCAIHDKYLLITSILHPEQMRITDDLRSRLRTMEIIKIGNPDTQTFYNLLHKYFCDYQLMYNDRIVNYIVARIPHSFKAMSKFFKLLSLQMTVNEKNKINYRLIDNILRDLNTSEQ